MPEYSDFNFIREKNKRENRPTFLYELYYTDSDLLRYTNWVSDLAFGGNTYTAGPIKHEEITENTQSGIDTVEVRVGNVDRTIQAYIESYDGFRGHDVRIRQIWQNRLDDPDCVRTEKFKVDRVEFFETEAIFHLASPFDVLDVELPLRGYDRTFCSWKEFKNSDCKYAGAETECNRTFDRCIELDNIINFGAFPSIPEKPIWYGQY